MDPVDTDPNFEPQQRARSNTWPLPRPENYGEKDVDGSGTGVDGQSSVVGGVAPKKNSSRRNAWGNMSYADLITQAIQSSPETRLTLSQIYDWMVQNVPYFKDKGDSNSSAGWKNSIRHNLSLHNRFMRVQNEGTGKSSWWMINPDAKPGKAARRRATSMETQKYEKRRGRVKKKVDALRNGLDATPSPSSSISESLDIFPDSPANLHPGFQLSPDFRPRASSNASSCGRLSPIPALEGDQSAPLSPLGWPQEPMAHLYGADQLVETLTETMKLGRSTPGNGGNDGYMGECGTLKTSPTSQLSPHLASQGSNGYMHAAYATANASQYADYASGYADAASKLSPLPRSPQRAMQMHDNANTSFTITNLQALSPAPSVHSLSPPHSMDTTAPPQPPTSTSTTTSSNSSTTTSTTGPQQPAQASQQRLFGADRHPDTTITTLTTSLLNQPQSSAYRITSHPASRLVTTSGFCALTLTTPASVAPQMLPGSTNSSHCLLRQGSSGLGPMPSASQMMGHLMAINNGIPSGAVMPNGIGVPNGIGIPNDLDLSIDSFQSGLECDVDQVIRHELSVDGNLDFNFAEPPTQMPVAPASSNGHHWVH